MYFPYLRGRQFELLALRELAENNLLGHSVIPIIEPVKLSSTLINTIKQYIKSKKHISIIHNPLVGDFASDMQTKNKDSHISDFIDLFSNEYVIKAHIINLNSEKQIDFWEKRGVKKNEWLVINTNRDFFDTYRNIFKDVNPKYVLIPDESNYRRKILSNKILLADKFEKKTRNVDYSINTDEPFSEDHLYYKNDGYIGFSDYSIIGRGYFESGFAPYAVAIHIVYFGIEDNLRISHFVSNSNEDISNPAKKFYEAVSKLSFWYTKNKPTKTYGLELMLNHYRNETYPGLGSIKKLSIMHHLELMGKYLDTKE